MLSERDKEIVVQCAKKYNATSVFLFGSSIEEGREANDIDLGVKGIRPQVFFKFYAKLINYLSKCVDLVDLSQKSLFNDLLEEDGVKIYG